MNKKPQLILLASSALLLASCGGGHSSTSSSTPPALTPSEYFSSFRAALAKTKEANDIRAYTPHANVKLNFAENGYGKLSAGGKIYTRVGAAKGEATEQKKEQTPADSFTETSADFSLLAERIPLDVRFHNLQSKNKKTDFASSFVNAIGDVDPKVKATFGTLNLPSLSSSVKMYADNGVQYVDASEFSSILSMLGAQGEKFKDGKIAYDYGSDSSLPSSIPGLNLFDSFLSFDEKSYNEDKELWTLSNNNEIAFTLPSEQKLLQRTVKGLRSHLKVDEASGLDKVAKEAEVAAFQVLLEETLLPLMEFDSFTYGFRWNEQGRIDYSYQKLRILDFDQEKLYKLVSEYDGSSLHELLKLYGKDIELIPGLSLGTIDAILTAFSLTPRYVGEKKSFLIPDDEMSYSLGLAYQYEGADLAPAKLSEQEKRQFKTVTKADIAALLP